MAIPVATFRMTVRHDGCLVDDVLARLAEWATVSANTESCASQTAPLDVVCVIAQYSLLSSTNSRDTTFIEWCWQATRSELWIDWLHVAPVHRRRGVGSRLARASEDLADRLQARRLCVFPLHSARAFWARAGYVAHPRLSRAMLRQGDRPLGETDRSSPEVQLCGG